MSPHSFTVERQRGRFLLLRDLAAVSTLPPGFALILSLRLITFAVTCTDAAEPVPPLGRKIATANLPDNTSAFGYIESPTRAQLFLRKKDEWTSAAIVLRSAVFVPGAALTLAPVSGEELPSILTVGSDGRFVQIVPHKPEPEINVIGEMLLPPGADFAEAQRLRRRIHFAVDLRGRLWELDLEAKKQELIEERADLLLPGGAVRTLPDEANELFLIDRRGNLVSYLRDPVVRWKGPRLVGIEFVAGSDLAVWRRPDNQRELQVGAVNMRGELHVGRLESTGWRMQIIPGWLFPAGAPIGVWHTPVNMRFCAVTAEGVLQEIHMRNTEWIAATICEGFPWKSQALFLGGPSAPGVDLAGNFVWTLTRNDSRWKRDVVTPDASEPVRLIRREWKTAEALNSVEVEFANRSSNELTVRLRDRRVPATFQDFPLGASAQVKVRLDRHEAGHLEDTLISQADARKADSVKREEGDGEGEEFKPETVPNDATRLERKQPASSQSLYDVEVLFPGYSVEYVDLRETPWPPIRPKQPAAVSAGQFALPAEVSVPSGSQIDVLQSAQNRRMSVFRP